MFVPQVSSIMEGAKYSGGAHEWRVLRKARKEVTSGTYCSKSETINDAFRNSFLDHNLSVISQTVLLLEINTLIFVPSVRNAKSLGSKGCIRYKWI